MKKSFPALLCATALALALVIPVRSQTYTFTTLAGYPGYGSADGLGRSPKFKYPARVAVDSTGNIYVADSGDNNSGNNTIRKITPAGVVTTLAGQAGSPGSADGTGSAARFASPTGVAVDSAGNMYVADSGNNTIRKITSSGVVTTLAGQAGSPGSTDGTGSAARFATPAGVAVDSAGNVYVADFGNNTIRKITSGGAVTTLAGSAGNGGGADGTGSAARFSQPNGLAVDSMGNVYVADEGNETIRKITSAGVVTTLAGSAASPGSADGTGSAARFDAPFGVAVGSAGDVYVADALNLTIRKITPAGVVTTLAGSPGNSGSADGTGGAARFASPVGVAVDRTGNVYVADFFNYTIRKITSAGVVTTLAGLDGSPGSEDGTVGTITASFHGPTCAVVDSAGNIYVADTGNSTIRKITPGGAVTTLAGSAVNTGSVDGTGTAARFYYPRGVALDGAGNLYVADTYNHTIRKITSAGVVTTLAGLAGVSGSADGTGSAARFYHPTDVAVDNAGNIYVADSYNDTIRKITSGGVVTTLAGLAGSFGNADGTGSAARFYQAQGVSVDSTGNVYVADSGNNTIRKVTSAGVVTTIAGMVGHPGSTDGTGSAAQFNSPYGAAVDGTGNLYVADFGNETIRKITSAGAVTTLAGLASIQGSLDGTNSAARFNQPESVAVDSAGNVYVADSGNNSIRQIATNGLVTTTAGIVGGGVSADGTGITARFYSPWGAAVDSAGNVYVGDSGNSTIRKITPGGIVTTLAGLAGNTGSVDDTGAAARFHGPRGVALDSAGNVYVADYGNSTIRKITSGGVVATLAGSAGSQGSLDGTGKAAQFYSPSGVAVDNAGNVYVADTGNDTIRKITSGGVVTTLAGLGGSYGSMGIYGSADGTGSAARFNSPSGVAVDSGGNVYVADYGNSTIRKITSAGMVTTLAGLAGSIGSTDGTGSTARFFQPEGVAVDSAGNIYVADSYNFTIRKITSAGAVTTLAGLALTPGIADGTSSAARFWNPIGVALDSAGNLFVADTANDTIRLGTLSSDTDIGLRVFDGYNTVKIAIQSGTLTSPLHLSKNGTIYAVQLVSPSDPNASRVHMQTSSGVMAWKTLP